MDASSKNTALVVAVMRSDLDAARAALDAVALPDAREPHGAPVLVVAAGRGDVPMVELLLERGADPTATDGRGTTALMAALRTGSLAIIDRLCRAVSVQHRDQHVAYAALLDDPAGLTRLLERGGDPDAPGPRGRTALLEAVAAQNLPRIELLLARGASLDAPDPRGVTPLMLAVTLPSPELVALLLERGADASRRDAEGRRAVDLAEARDDDAMLARLRHARRWSTNERALGLVSLALLVIALYLACDSWISWRQIEGLRARGVEIAGVVEEAFPSRQRGAPSYVVVRYELAGPARTAHLPVVDARSFSPGDGVELQVDPSAPERVMLRGSDADENLFVYRRSLPFASLAFILGVLALFALRRSRRQPTGGAPPGRPARAPEPSEAVALHARARGHAYRMYEIMRDSGCDSFLPGVRGILGELDAADELGPERALRNADSVYRSMLGGMGSLLDVYIHHDDPAERDRLNDEFTAARIALGNALLEIRVIGRV